MVDFQELIATGERFRKKLESIREELGVEKAIFNVGNPKINRNPIGKEVEDVARKTPNQPIILEDGRFYMLYVKDHTHYYRDEYEAAVRKHPVRCFVNANELHFYYCRTLTQMTEHGRFKKYCYVSHDVKGAQLIELKDASNVLAQLPVCRNCIEILEHKKPITSLSKSEIATIAERVDVNELMNYVRLLHHNEQSVEDNFLRNMTN